MANANNPSLSLGVVIRTRDEADRLRLTLASLETQARETEIVVVDDGSADHTQAVLAEAVIRLPRLRMIRHSTPRGRSAASNAGATAAEAEILLFLDGDTLTAPDLLARHCAAHAEDAGSVVVRGETWHVRCTRWLQDPDTGTPFPAQEASLAARPAAERDRMRVTLHQVRHAFGEVVSRAQPGIYPGDDPRRLHALEMATLVEPRGCNVLWAAAAGSNQSVRRADFLAAGGFHPDMDINEHRELTLRLVQMGARMRGLPGACTFHMTHRSRWRDPLRNASWEAVFLTAHPRPAVALLALFWATLARHPSLANGPRIETLHALDLAARTPDAAAFDAARQRLGLPALGAAFWYGT